MFTVEYDTCSSVQSYTAHVLHYMNKANHVNAYATVTEYAVS